MFTFDALYIRQVLLDQLKEGLKLIGALKLIQTFPNETLSLFTSQGADDVLEAVDVKVSEGLKPEDEVLVKFLQRYIRSLTVCTFLLYNDGVCIKILICRVESSYVSHHWLTCCPPTGEFAEDELSSPMLVPL